MGKICANCGSGIFRAIVKAHNRPIAGNATKVGSVITLTTGVALAPKFHNFSNKLIDLLQAAAIEALEFVHNRVFLFINVTYCN